MKDKMILKDGTAVELESGASLGNVQVVFSNKASMVETWDKFTDENLKSVQITDGNDAVIAEYTDLVLVSNLPAFLADASKTVPILFFMVTNG